jgi:hypothetical protein
MINELIDKSIEGIPYVQRYKYLGITIDTNGSIEEHLKYLNKRSNYLSKKLTNYPYNLEIK